VVNDVELEKRVQDREDGAATTTTTSKSTSTGPTSERKGKPSAAKSRLSRAWAEMQEQELDPTIVKLGDASIASPFTARRTSIDCVLSVLRQGRCTLVTTIQVRGIDARSLLS